MTFLKVVTILIWYWPACSLTPNTFNPRMKWFFCRSSSHTACKSISSSSLFWDFTLHHSTVWLHYFSHYCLVTRLWIVWSAMHNFTTLLWIQKETALPLHTTKLTRLNLSAWQSTALCSFCSPRLTPTGVLMVHDGSIIAKPVENDLQQPSPLSPWPVCSRGGPLAIRTNWIPLWCRPKKIGGIEAPWTKEFLASDAP